MAVQVGANLLENINGGRGILLGGGEVAIERME